MKYQYIEQHRDPDLSLEVPCKLLSVSRGGYHKWRGQVADKVAQEHRKCLLIRQVWEASGKTYGSPRIYHELRAQGIKISQKRVAKLMKKLGITGAGKKRRKWQTTVSTAAHPVAERLFKTETSQAHNLAPNQIWTGDMGLLKKYRHQTNLTACAIEFMKMVGADLHIRPKVESLHNSDRHAPANLRKPSVTRCSCTTPIAMHHLYGYRKRNE